MFNLKESGPKINTFRKALMTWHYGENNRVMPWKGEKDPYRIWLSEVMLQQTRVEQGLGYYLRFLEAFPTIGHLARAKDEKVFKLWEGLGYYARCRNLLATARKITHEMQGTFPTDYPSLLQLPGIGPYTAAAIASFAFNLPHAVVDGNVIRVLSRYFKIHEPFDQPTGKKLFQDLAQKALDVTAPGPFNQAIMDLGATICKAQLPLCSLCPLAKGCQARAVGVETDLPVRKSRIKKTERFFIFLILEYKGRVWVQERSSADIWRNLYEFLTIELAAKNLWEHFNLNEFLEKQSWEVLHPPLQVATTTQALTHQTVRGRFYRVKLKRKITPAAAGKWVKWEQTRELAFPKTIQQGLQQWQQDGLL